MSAPTHNIRLDERDIAYLLEILHKKIDSNPYGSADSLPAYAALGRLTHATPIDVDGQVIYDLQMLRNRTIHRLDGALDGASRLSVSVTDFVDGNPITRPKWMTLPDDDGEALIKMSKLNTQRVAFALSKLKEA